MSLKIRFWDFVQGLFANTIRKSRSLSLVHTTDRTEMARWVNVHNEVYSEHKLSLLSPPELFAVMKKNSKVAHFFEMLLDCPSESLFPARMVMMAQDTYEYGLYRTKDVMYPDTLAFKCPKGYYLIKLRDGMLTIRLLDKYGKFVTTNHHTGTFILIFNELTGVNICDYL